jgi:hypothetical protein
MIEIVCECSSFITENVIPSSELSFPQTNNGSNKIVADANVSGEATWIRYALASSQF